MSADSNSEDQNIEEGFVDAVDSEEDMAASLREEDDESFQEGDEDESSSALQQQPHHQRARDHSYLPGPPHPLLHETDAPLHGSSQKLSYNPQEESQSGEQPLTEIPILELPGVVLFPGCTLPIRLSNRPWIQYLGRQIDASRKVGSPDFGRTVQLGILTLEDNTVISRGRDGGDQRRRSSWLRRGITNTRRQQRLSRIIQQELFGNAAASDDNSSDSDDDNENNNTGRNSVRRRNLHPFVGRIGTIATITYTHGDAVLDRQSNSNSASGVWQQHAEEQGELIVKAVGTSRFQVETYLDFQSFADVQVFQVQEYQHDHNPLQMPTHQMIGLRPRLAYDFMANSDANKATSDNQNVGEESMNDAVDESVMDVDAISMSTTTYSPAKQFVSYHESLIRQLSSITPIPYVVLKQTWPWRLVGQMVQMLEESKAANQTDDAGEDDDSGMETEQGGQRTSLLASLAELLHDEPSLLDSPTQFSFWMASNLPLSIDDKLKLLQAQSTLQRLKLLKSKLTEYARPACALCCQGCHITLARVDSVFTVGGADGTTGNYVNEHGFIHQVLTLRKVRESKLYCSGRASTENSYFPGYSWTITYCNRCASLLGWKFNWVGGGGRTRPQNSENYPDSFFGFMSSSLVTS